MYEKEKTERHALNRIPDHTLFIRIRLPNRDHIILRSDPNSLCDRCVNTERLLDDCVKIWQSHEIVHGWHLGVEREKLVAKFSLDVGRLSEREQSPGGSCRGCFVACDDEAIVYARIVSKFVCRIA